MRGLRVVIPVLFYFIGQSNGVFWNDFRITFSLRFPENGFTPFPQTEQEAKERRFYRDSPNCLNNGEFYGFRYVDPEDNFVAVLYDVQGTVAGIQLMFPESLLRERSDYKYAEVPMWQRTTRYGQSYYMLNVYFVKVENICTGGRPKCALLYEGTGTGVYIQNGDSKKIQVLPNDRASAIRKGWGENACVPGMGNHNYYLADRWGENNCQRVMMQPYFGLYNQQDELHGFGFTIVRAIPNKRFEVQTKGNIMAAQGAATPKCVLDKVDTSGITTLHVYFTKDPWRHLCPGMPSLMDLIKSIDRDEMAAAAKQDTSNCPKPPGPVVYTSTTSTGPSAPPLTPRTRKGGTQSGETRTGTDFVIPQAVMRTIQKMNEQVEADSRKSVADDLPPGTTFEDVDITHALMNHVENDHIGYEPTTEPDMDSALRLWAQNNPDKVTHNYSGDEVMGSPRNGNTTTVIYGGQLPPGTLPEVNGNTRIENHIIYA